MKKCLGFVLIGFVSIGSATAACPSFSLPSQFEVQERMFAIGTDFRLEADDRKFGEIEERVLSLTSTFDLLDLNGRKIAHARKRMISWGAIIDVTDCEGKVIGTVREKVWSSLFKVATQYEVTDQTGKVVATSEKREFFSTDFKFSSPSGTALMKMHRQSFNILSDTWMAMVTNASALDARIAVFIPAFKTAADNEKRKNN